MDNCLKFTLRNYNFYEIDIEYTNNLNIKFDNNSSTLKSIEEYPKKDEFMPNNISKKEDQEIISYISDKSTKYIPPHKNNNKSNSLNQSNKNKYQNVDQSELRTTKNGSISNKDISIIDDEKMAMRKKRFETNKHHKQGSDNSSNNKTKKYDYGLVSRGDDNRLKESQSEREEFFLYILNKFIRYTSQSSSQSLSETIEKLKESNPEDFESAKSLNSQDDQQTHQKSDDEVILEILSMDLRKLRESLLNIPPSKFHKKVFLFSIRFSNYFGHFKTYIPSINYLMNFEKQLNLTRLEVEEIAIILILHTIHVNNDAQQSIFYYHKYIPNRVDILRIIRYWIHIDYYQWMKTYNTCENYTIRSMMSLGLNKILNKMIHIVTASYYNLHKDVLERYYLPKEMSYGDFSKKYKVNWVLEENGNVIIRSRSSRK
ncbi:uncharacterized protein KGF55_001183 [Candida pseudojiufengensis]|uniref:uncharacterized protein n=1 Tax=Candida pseudojiufengensis TaxID=497109 RepID=UPI002224CDB8|nr:uncharacterized protein KGF55_001183 [Candida pseudojiufengensis]KAI5965820.1 hypothetical protein KGF55_001183 [Candida pseudojiufengensis]